MGERWGGDEVLGPGKVKLSRRGDIGNMEVVGGRRRGVMDNEIAGRDGDNMRIEWNKF